MPKTVYVMTMLVRPKRDCTAEVPEYMQTKGYVRNIKCCPRLLTSLALGEHQVIVKIPKGCMRIPHRAFVRCTVPKQIAIIIQDFIVEFLPYRMVYVHLVHMEFLTSVKIIWEM